LAAGGGATSASGTLTIHERAKLDRRGLKAFRLDLLGVGSRTRVSSTNLKLTPTISKRLTSEVERWAIGSTECLHVDVTPPAPQRTPGRPRIAQRPF
ncbi:MAG: hypothetical protein AAFQ35_07235, partial [Pseudomonadota bacterium]